MAKFSQTKDCDITHQDSLWNTFRKFIGFASARPIMDRRIRLNAAELPVSLQRDIGWRSSAREVSFEERWLRELNDLRR